MNIWKRSTRSWIEALEQGEGSRYGIDAIAVTQGPGLVGSLLVGVCYAKALAFGLDIPLVGVNHIEGHVFSVIFENPEIEYPGLGIDRIGRTYKSFLRSRNRANTKSYRGRGMTLPEKRLIRSPKCSDSSIPAAR